MDFDIIRADSARKFFNDFMGFSNFEWIEKIIVDCNSDIDLFIEKHIEHIANKDISSVRFTGFHLTTVKDECAEIKQLGLKSLRDVLSSDSDLCGFLLERGICFDMSRNILNYNGKEYDVDYSHCKGTYRANILSSIAHRLCYDPQVNGFLCCSNPWNYSTIQRYPEFLLKIEDCFPALSGLGEAWASNRKPFIITFSVPFNKIAWYTFYEEIDGFYADSDTRLELKKKLLRLSYDRMQENDTNCYERYIYISGDCSVESHEIVRCESI